MSNKSQIEKFNQNLALVLSSPDFKAALKKAESTFKNIILKIQDNDLFELDSHQANEISQVYKLKQDINFMPFYVLNMRLKELKNDLYLRDECIAKLERNKAKISYQADLLLKELKDAREQIKLKDTALKHAIDNDLFSDKNHDAVQADLDLYAAALNYSGSLLWAVEIAKQPGADYVALPAESKDIALQIVQRMKKLNRADFRGNIDTIKAANDCIRVNVWNGSKDDHTNKMIYTEYSLKHHSYTNGVFPNKDFN